MCSFSIQHPMGWVVVGVRLRGDPVERWGTVEKALLKAFLPFCHVLFSVSGFVLFSVSGFVGVLVEVPYPSCS